MHIPNLKSKATVAGKVEKKKPARFVGVPVVEGLICNPLLVLVKKAFANFSDSVEETVRTSIVFVSFSSSCILSDSAYQAKLRKGFHGIDGLLLSQS